MENVFIQHLGYIFTFLALSVKDVLWLRIILATAQITLGVYQFIEQRLDVVFGMGCSLLLIFTILTGLLMIENL